MKKIKERLVSRHLEDGVIIEADYRQLEIRVLALASGDPTLIQDLNEGKDLHKLFAAQIFAKGEDEVAPKERKLAKAFSFELQYGAGVDSIASHWKVDKALVKSFIEAYYNRYPKIAVFHDVIEEKTLMASRYKGTVVGDPPVSVKSSKIPGIWKIKPETEVGAYAIDQAIYDHKRPKPVFPRTKLKNYPIQGGAADILALKLNELRKDFIPRWAAESKTRLKFINTVHDSLIFDSVYPGLHISHMLDELRDILEGVPKTIEKTFGLDCPIEFPVDISVGLDLTTGLSLMEFSDLFG